jgi:hypothetical protein
VRYTFLRLAARYHPDLAADAETQHRHTYILMELNGASRAGDAAALFAFERAMNSAAAGELAATGPDDEERCRKLEAEIAMLKDQFRALADQVAAMRRSEMGELVAEYRRLKRATRGDPIDYFAAEVNEDVESLTEIRDFVRNFRDRKITIAAFVRGPASFQVDTEKELQEAIDDLLHAMVGLVEVDDDDGASRGSRRRGSAGEERPGGRGRSRKHRG